MKCECGGTLRYDGRTMVTLVGYHSPEGHDHDDNCRTRYYGCEECGVHRSISIRNRCSHPSCDWVGKATCFCHPGEKLDEWPMADEPEKGIQDG